jgi:hypothetical protein
MKINSFLYLEGSKWRRWDLHVHTPFSYLSNQFSNDFNKYVKQLFKKALEKDIAAIGITDYFTIEGYKKLKNEYLDKDEKLEELGFSGKEIDKIKKILILPNIEFRLNKLVGSNRINFHVIFSDEVSINDIEENFLREIKFVYQGRPQIEDEKRPLTLQNLEALGKKLKEEHKEFKSKSDVEAGMMNAVVDDTEIMKILSNKKSIFEGKYLTFVPADEDLSKILWDSQDHNVRKVIIQKSNGFFSSNQETRKFGLGHKHPSLENFRKEFETLKPCIWGSDAKSYEKLFEPDLKRYTWIKADPTFKGLKQIIYEPEERVYIGEEPPRKIERDKIIKSLTISNSNQWFEDSKPIPLNDGLVSIIGGKGTGKTAVLDLIAYPTKSYRCYEKDEIKSKSFLRKAYKELKNIKIKIEWDEGSPDEIVITDKLEEVGKEGKVRYLPQDFIDQLCSEIGKNELEEQIENVIFQKIPPEDKAGFTNFRDYKEDQLTVINDKKDRVIRQIQEINLKISEHNELIKSKSSKSEEIKKIESDIEKFDQEMKKISDYLEDSKEQKGILGELNSSIEQKSDLEKIISDLNVKLRKIEEVKNKINEFVEDSKKFTKELKDALKKVDINQEEIRFVLYPENLEEILNGRKNKIENEIGEQKNKLSKLDEEIKELNSKITLEKSRQDKIKEINESLSDLKKKRDSANCDIEKIEDAEKTLPDLLNKRESLFINYFELIFEEKERLKKIYSPLENLLRESIEENEKFFEFTVKFNFDLNIMTDEGHKLIDLRADGRFRQTRPEILKEKLEELIFRLDLDREKISETDKESVKTFIKNVEGLFIENNRTISSQLKEKYIEQDFLNWLYSTRYYSISYSIKFNGLELNNLSPGLKGVALLILFLKLDKDDKRPILIDQPEENLDNRSVYTTLVRYFREAKKRRQVIIVTHNPNLVVNADSEQVIVANLDRDLENQTSRISYVSGSLENTFKNDSATTILRKQGIREHVCEILEGGEEAFKKREDKYQIK